MNSDKQHAGKTSEGGWQLIIQPGDGTSTLLQAINNAKKSIEILIFRFDQDEIEQALIAAVRRGVSVQALIAWTNRGGDRSLRALETRLLAQGVTIARTADDLIRYHGKMMIADRKRLYVLAFNFTALDTESSRSFGIVTDSVSLIKDAARLFEADCRRLPFTPTPGGLIVSPLNARETLAEFIKGADKELLIYDPCAGDPQMIRLLEEKKRSGVNVRFIGSLKRSRGLIDARALKGLRLHTRTIIRDGHVAFVGSQSLRASELDGRREVGLLVSKKPLVAAMAKVFEDDWAASETVRDEAVPAMSRAKLAKKVAKAITKELPPVNEIIEAVAAEMPPDTVDVAALPMEELQEAIREAVKAVVKESLEDSAAVAATRAQTGV